MVKFLKVIALCAILVFAGCGSFQTSNYHIDSIVETKDNGRCVVKTNRQLSDFTNIYHYFDCNCEDVSANMIMRVQAKHFMLEQPTVIKSIINPRTGKEIDCVPH
ncbi:MAG: hypothetical protein FWC41_02880 [Firmicutes bacterium]|nr:hypothetical protein [Bacillota bacterium]